MMWRLNLDMTAGTFLNLFTGRLKWVLIGCLSASLVSCQKKDDRFPAYYRYKLQVKVDGQPVTLDRVIKCTGTLKKDAGNPSVWGGKNYSNPPVVGARVPGSTAAVFVPALYACGWAAKFKGDFWQEPPAQEGDIMPVLLVKDTNTYSDIEYYVSRTALLTDQSNVEFVNLFPLERVTEADFLMSEKQAAKESPNLTAFISLVDDKQLKSELSKNTKFTKNVNSGKSISCVGAWLIHKDEWSLVPNLSDWVNSLSSENNSYRVPSDLWVSFDDTTKVNAGYSIARGLVPIDVPSEKQRLKGGRYSTFEELHPVIFKPDSVYVDLDRQGLAGCYDRHRFPGRELSRQPNIATKNEAGHYQAPYELTGNELEISLSISSPYFVPALESFVIFKSPRNPGGQISEQIELGVN